MLVLSLIKIWSMNPKFCVKYYVFMDQESNCFIFNFGNNVFSKLAANMAAISRLTNMMRDKFSFDHYYS